MRRDVVLDGRYTLKVLLGEGAFGQVFLAWQSTASGEPLLCVVKFPQPKDVADPGVREAFLREGRLASRLQNQANVVKVLDIGVHQGMPYIVMEYIDGVDLGVLLDFTMAVERKNAMRKAGVAQGRAGTTADGRRGLSLAAGLQVITDLTKGLNWAHFGATDVRGEAVAVVHRDVKPANVLVTRDGYSKLADFGISTTVADGTVGEVARGSVRYMSPEHVRGEVCPAMDIYSLGVLAYEVLENRVYKEGYTESQLVLSAKDGQTPEMNNPGTPQVLRTLIADCLSPNAQRRPKAAVLLQLFSRHGLLGDTGELCRYLDMMLGARRSRGLTDHELVISPALQVMFGESFGPADSAPRSGRKRSLTINGFVVREPELVGTLRRSPRHESDEEALTRRRPVRKEADLEAVTVRRPVRKEADLEAVTVRRPVKADLEVATVGAHDQGGATVRQSSTPRKVLRPTQELLPRIGYGGHGGSNGTAKLQHEEIFPVGARPYPGQTDSDISSVCPSTSGSSDALVKVSVTEVGLAAPRDAAVPRFLFAVGALAIVFMCAVVAGLGGVFSAEDELSAERDISKPGMVGAALPENDGEPVLFDVPAFLEDVEPALPSVEPALPSVEPALPSVEPALPSVEPSPSAEAEALGRVPESKPKPKSKPKRRQKRLPRKPGKRMASVTLGPFPFATKKVKIGGIVRKFVRGASFDVRPGRQSVSWFVNGRWRQGGSIRFFAGTSVALGADGTGLKLTWIEDAK